MENRFNLDNALLHFAGEDDSTAFTIRNACESIIVLGNTGAGKTSSTGAAISSKYLKAGFGFLILCVKEDEALSWQEYARRAGREKDVVMVKPGGGHYFNFLEYESTVTSRTSYAHNILNLLQTVLSASEDRQGSSRDPFWDNALELYLLNLINLCLLAYGEVTVQLLYDIAQSAPKKPEDGVKQSNAQADQPQPATDYNKAMNAAKERMGKVVEAWKRKQADGFLDTLSEDDYKQLVSEAIPDYRTLHMVRKFFTDGFYRISEKTRSIIEFSFSSFLNRLLSEPIYSIFCGRPSTLTPESCFSGAIVIIDLPVKIFDKVGQDAQTLVKYAFQKAWERRTVTANSRPLCLWADEAHFFLTPYDTVFQTTARSSKIAVVYLSQNLPNFYAVMGGDSKKAEYKVKSFMATLTTKIFHANNCQDTNEFGSSLIGQSYVEDLSSSVNVGKDVGYTSGSKYTLERIVRPEMFSRLKTGGPLNNLTVECYIHRQGITFKNGCNHKKIKFSQTPNPSLHQ